ncbi:MAG TPA: GNAT family N-acetyltransferase [Lysobacter sp.]
MTPDALTSRPATEADVPFLLALRRQTMHAHLAASGADTSEAHHLERLRRDFGHARVLELDGRPVGLLKVRRASGEWEIVQIQLGPELQGKGLGRALLQQVIDEATAAGAGLRLSVLKANPARRLYERLGFVVVGEKAQEYVMRRAAASDRGP